MWQSFGLSNGGDGRKHLQRATHRLPTATRVVVSHPILTDRKVKGLLLKLPAMADMTLIRQKCCDVIGLKDYDAVKIHRECSVSEEVTHFSQSSSLTMEMDKCTDDIGPWFVEWEDDCVAELQKNDHLVLWNDLSNVGPRQSLSSLFRDYKHNNRMSGKLESLVSSYYGWRTIRGDGNCYYRAVYYALLEQALVKQEYTVFQRLFNKMKKVNYIDPKAKQAHQELLLQLKNTADGRGWQTTSDLEYAAIHNEEFDQAIVRACRYMVSDYLKLNRDTILQGHGDVCFGDVILPFYPDVRGMDEYCEKYVQPMGVDAEGAFVFVGVLMRVLQCHGYIIVLDRNEEADLAVYEGGASCISSQQLCCGLQCTASEVFGEVHLLYRPGHYSMLYPRANTPIIEHYFAAQRHKKVEDSLPGSIDDVHYLTKLQTHSRLKIWCNFKQLQHKTFDFDDEGMKLWEGVYVDQYIELEQLLHTCVTCFDWAVGDVDNRRPLLCSRGVLLTSTTHTQPIRLQYSSLQKTKYINPRQHLEMKDELLQMLRACTYKDHIKLVVEDVVYVSVNIQDILGILDAHVVKDHVRTMTHGDNEGLAYVSIVLDSSCVTAADMMKVCRSLLIIQSDMFLRFEQPLPFSLADGQWFKLTDKLSIPVTRILVGGQAAIAHAAVTSDVVSTGVSRARSMSTTEEVDRKGRKGNLAVTSQLILGNSTCEDEFYAAIRRSCGVTAAISLHVWLTRNVRDSDGGTVSFTRTKVVFPAGGESTSNRTVPVMSMFRGEKHISIGIEIAFCEADGCSCNLQELLPLSCGHYVCSGCISPHTHTHTQSMDTDTSVENTGTVEARLGEGDSVVSSAMSTDIVTATHTPMSVNWSPSCMEKRKTFVRIEPKNKKKSLPSPPIRTKASSSSSSSSEVAGVSNAVNVKWCPVCTVPIHQTNQFLSLPKVPEVKDNSPQFCSLRGVIGCSDEAEAVTNMLQLGCGHWYHPSCFSVWLLHEMSLPPCALVCPECVSRASSCHCLRCKLGDEGVKNDGHWITEEEVRILVNHPEVQFEKTDKDKWHDFTAAYCISLLELESLVTCNHCGDVGVIPRSDHYTCSKCSSKNCSQCGLLYHRKLSCEEAKLVKSREANEIAWKSGVLVQCCPSCVRVWGVPVDCLHAQCDRNLGGCGQEFCYLCAAPRIPIIEHDACSSTSCAECIKIGAFCNPPFPPDPTAKDRFKLITHAEAKHENG